MVSSVLLCAFVAAFVGLVHSKDLEVTIEPNVRTLLVPSGKRLVLNCSVTNHEDKEETITWVTHYNKADLPDIRRDVSQELNPEGKFNTKKELIIESFTPKYDGKFDCTHVQGSKKTQASIQLTAITEEKSDQTYHYGNETVTLFCTANLGDKAEFKEWIRDDKVLEDGKEYKILENGTLTIPELKGTGREYAGQYKARYNLNDGTNNTYDCMVDLKAGPLVLDLDKSINKDEGETVDLRCDVLGWPIPEVTWFKGDKEVKEVKDKISFHSYGGVPGAQLTITELEFDHADKYSCRAYSAEFNQTSEKSITLRVKDKLAWLWPFLGIIAEAFVLVLLVLFFEKVKKKGDSESNHPHEQ